MFWADNIADEFLKEYADVVKERKVILRDEKTLSGRPHVGSLRSFTMHAIISDVLTSRGVDHEYFYEINDTDALEKVPSYVPAEWKEHLGKPLRHVPAPDGVSENYAMQFAKEYTDALEDAKYPVTFYVNSKRYLAGEYDKYIKLALDNKDKIREIYRTVSGSEKPETWYPCQVICDECGKIATTTITAWDGEEVEYECNIQKDWRKGCGHKGKKSPFRGEATLPWKVEWAAKFCVVEVDLEGAGKDHYAAGGSRHVSNRICEEIFGRKHPFDVRHEFILLEGGKMSSSSGLGMSASDLYDTLPRYLFRFMMVQKDVMKTINFSPDGDTVPVLFDQYDQVCSDYFAEDQSEVKEHKNRFFELAHYHEGSELSHLDRFLPRFSQVSFYVQMPHVDIYSKFEGVKGSPLTEADKAELDTRIEYAKKWLENWGPEKYIFKIQEEMPELAQMLSEAQKNFLGVLAGYLSTNTEAEGEEIQAFIHQQKEALGMKPLEIFQSIYAALLGKDSGPKAGWLLEALDNAFLLKRFEEVSKSENIVVEEKEIEIPEDRLKNDYFVLSEEAAKQFPEVQIAYAVIEGIQVSAANEALEDLKSSVVPSQEVAAKRLDELNILNQYNDIFKRMGVDVTKRMPTSRALLNRLAKGKELYAINNVVDVCNVMALEDGISFGAFDMDKIKFPIVFSLTKGGEEFWPLMEKKAKRVGPGELCMIDAEGKLLNRDYNYRDCDFTKITEDTKNVFLTMDSLDPMPVEEAFKKLEEAVEKFTTYCGGELKLILVA